MGKEHDHAYDKCSLEEPNMAEVMKDPDTSSPYLYVTPTQDLEVYQSGFYPDCWWPEPYEGVFDHVREGVTWESANDEAFFATNIASNNECKNQLDQSQVDYLNACYSVGIIPQKNFFNHLQEKSIIIHDEGIDCDEIQAMCKLLSENLTVTKLDISDNQIREQGAFYLSNLLLENDMINEIDVSYNGLGDDGCCKVLESLAKTGFILNLSGNHITDKSLPTIANAVKEEEKMKSLILSDNRLGQFPTEPEKCLQSAIASNWSLEELDLSWNNFIGSQSLRLLMGIKDNVSITWLNLSHNGLSDKECITVLKSLVNNHSLQYLDISSNFITSIGAKSVARGIKVNETLATLRVGQNYVDGAGALALLQAYTANSRSSLQILDLGDTYVDSSFMTLKEQLIDQEIEIKHGKLVRDGSFKDKPWNKFIEKYTNAPSNKPKAKNSNKRQKP